MPNRGIIVAIIFSLLALAGSAPPSSAETDAVPATMPDTTPPGKPHFDATGAKVGEQLPDLPVFLLDGKSHSLADSWEAGTTLLITSSYTCPKSRSTYPHVAAMAAKLKGKVNFAVVYIIEAHPSRDPSPYSGVEDVTIENRRDGVLCAQPKTLEERIALASAFQKRLAVAVPIYVDAMDNAGWRAFGGGPNMGFLVSDKGIVLARQGWFDAESMQKAVNAFMEAVPVKAAKDDHAGVSGDYDEVRRPTIEGNLDKLRSQLNGSPNLATKVFPFFARGRSGDKTLLHYAVEHDSAKAPHLQLVVLLIAHGADVNKQTEHTPTPLHLAAANGSAAIAKFLIEHGARIDEKAQGYGPTPLQEALIHGNQDAAELLIKLGAKSNFFTHAASGNLDAVRSALDSDGSIAQRPDGWGRPPLAYAAAAGKAEMVKVLLNAGAKDFSATSYFDQRDRSAIWWAFENKNIPMIRLLCDHGSDPNLLDYAIYSRSVDIVRELLAHKADPNLEDQRGYRPLHLASVENCADIVDLLLAAGADAAAETGPDRAPCGPPISGGDSVLQLAAQQANVHIVSALLAHGAKVNALDAMARVPLHAAASSTKDPKDVVLVMKQLLAAGADINAKDERGITLLDTALQTVRTSQTPGDESAVKFLKEHGAKRGDQIDSPNGISPKGRIRRGF